MALLQDMFASCFESTAAEKQALKFWGTLDGTVLSGHTNINRNTSPLDQSRPQLVLDHRGRTCRGCLGNSPCNRL